MATNQSTSPASTLRQSTWQAHPRSHTLARGVKRRRLLPPSVEQDSEEANDDPPGAGGSLAEPPAPRFS